ncbi:MAG: murein biosynthesis integral membrane protein MurJ, partial [Pseudomonadota bacterium]
IAGIAQFAFQLPFLHRLRLMPRFTPAWRDPGVRRVLKLMTPAIFGVAVTQINLLLDTLIASFLVSGSISWLYYSDRLLEFPVGVLGVALGTVILPSLSAKHAEADPGHFAGTLDWAVRWVFLLGVPAAVGLIMLAGPLISTLFQSRVFDAHDVEMATRSLTAYSIGLLPFMLIKVLAPGFYARQDTKTPVKIAVVAMLVNMVMNLVLVWSLKHAGLALATSLAAATNATLLWVILQRQGIFQPGKPLRRVVVRAMLASAIMAVMLWQGSGTLESWTTAPLATKVWRLSLWVGAGASSYFALAFLFGIRARDFRR